eukprot:scaffold82330_cov54-Phaeocystis_antarctica.AAC.3
MRRCKYAKTATRARHTPHAARRTPSHSLAPSVRRSLPSLPAKLALGTRLGAHHPPRGVCRRCCEPTRYFPATRTCARSSRTASASSSAATQTARPS